MCGITGIFSQQGVGPYLHSLKRANQVASHRGPDGQGFAFFDSCETINVNLFPDENFPEDADLKSTSLAIGHRRLAIIDLSSHGAQPMPNSNESLWITYNGEIYNYIELRDELLMLGHRFRSECDTEVILEAYAEWGEDCVSRFNGIWAFAIVDLNRRRLFCSRDRFGVKPFHYYYDGERFVFGSEIKQLLCYPFVPKQMNRQAVYEYLLYSAVDYGEVTFFNSIYKLMQGQNLVVNLQDGSIKKSTYYFPEFKKDTDITYAEAAGEFRRLLTDSVRLQLRSDVEVGSCLSGGLDSSSIVCLMRDQLADNGKTGIQRTFSSHFDDEEANEIEFMQDVIRATNVHADFVYPSGQDVLDDLTRVVWHQDEPFGSTSIFAQWFVFKLVNQHGVKVMLDGQGADEMLAGYVGLYHYYFNQLKNRKQHFSFYYETYKYAQLHGQPWGPLIGGTAGRLVSRLFNQHAKPGFVHRSDWINQELVQQYQDQSLYVKNTQLMPFGESEQLENTLYQLTFLNNLQALLRHEDRNSMAFSVEARVPFLDHRLVEFIFSLPSSFKIRDGYTKRVLRDGMEGVIPERIRQRVKKLGFATPERKWRNTILKPLIEEAISSERMRAFVLPDKATDYYQQILTSDVADFAPWRWLNLFLWMNVYELE